MTKEEARKRLLDWIQYATDPERVPFMDEPCSDEEIILAMRIGADALSLPSLPSNLDEAADKYAKENCENYVDEEDGVTYIEEALRNTFKAGANWMAGLFVLVGGEPTGWFRANDGSEYATGLDLIDPIKLPVDFYVRKEGL